MVFSYISVGVIREIFIVVVSLGSSVLTSVTLPLNVVFLSAGATTETVIVIDPASGVRLVPLDGVNVHVPQLG